MRETYGVLYPAWEDSSARLKRYGMYFDKLYVANLEDMLSSEEARAIAPEGLLADLEYLWGLDFVRPISLKSMEHLFDTSENYMKCVRTTGALLSAAKPPEPSSEKEADYFGIDLTVRQLAVGIKESYSIDAIPIWFARDVSRLYPQTTATLGVESTLLRVTLDALPVPSEQTAWSDIFEFKADTKDKQWGFHRWLHSISTKKLSEVEIRDELEWSLNEYSKAMIIHEMKPSQGLVDVFMITPLEIIENLVKLNWSKIARGALSMQKRKVELMEAEMKAPGRECAYVFDARKRFGPR